MAETRRVRRPLRIATVGALGLGAAVLAAWASVHSLGLATTDPARMWLPSTPRGDMALAEQAFAAEQRIRPQDAAMVQRIAVRSPLASEPFAWTGYTALLERDAARAETLLTEAKQRSPRSRLTRMALMQIYATQGKLEPLAEELVPLLRLERDLIAPLTEQWVKAARTPQDIAVLAKVLKAEPAMFASVAEIAARNNLSPALIGAFLENNPLAGQPDSTRLERQLLLSLVEQGDVEGAYSAWQKRAKTAEPPAGGVFNGDFSDRSSPVPFNWDLMGGRDGVAEHRKEGGIFIDYFGRGSSPFARQLIRLPAGTYRLMITQKSDSAGSGGLAWTIRCASHGSATAAILLDRPVRPDSTGLDAVFSVPPACPAQWLTLESRGSLRDGDGQRLTVTRVEMQRSGAKP